MCEPLTVAKATSTTSTTVIDDATSATWSGSEHTGASAHDTATIGGQVSGFPASGTVTYSLFTNGACSGTATSTQNVTVNANGSVPTSSSTGALAGGSYAFRASYGGDSNYTTSTGACEPFTVATSATTVSTSVIDEATSAAWSGTEQTGATAHDTATIGGQVSGFPAGGTVIYSFFNNGACTGTAASTQTVTLNANGTVPNSSSTGALAGGSYAFRAAYSGDNSYGASTSACEPFSVKTTTTVSTTVIDNGTGLAWTNAEVVGASAH